MKKIFLTTIITATAVIMASTADANNSNINFRGAKSVVFLNESVNNYGYSNKRYYDKDCKYNLNYYSNYGYNKYCPTDNSYNLNYGNYGYNRYYDRDDYRYKLNYSRTYGYNRNYDRDDRYKRYNDRDNRSYSRGKSYSNKK
ncbi:MAG: hypothetical protein ACR2FN_11730 [Chitinophagaceae bacterium]